MKRLRGDSASLWEEEVEGHGSVADSMESARWSDDADMIGAVSIGHRAGPNDAYRLIIGWGSDSMR